MTLIIEDGTIVTGANSYVTDGEYTTYATARGITVGVDVTAREIELILAMDYVEGHREEFKGDKEQRDQPVQWPRVSVWIDGFPLDASTIPQELKSAQIEAAIAVASGGELLINSTCNQNIQTEKLDVMSVSYFDGGNWENIRLDRVDNVLDPLLKSGIGINAVAGRA